MKPLRMRGGHGPAVAAVFAGPAATNPHENGGNEIKVKRNLRIPIVFSYLCRVKVSATGVLSCRN